jgi:hypothetical protein
MFYLIVVVIVVMVINGRLAPRDDSDPKTGRRRSGLTVYTDQRTGLQYISGGMFGGIIPRLDSRGGHLQCSEWMKARNEAK